MSDNSVNNDICLSVVSPFYNEELVIEKTIVKLLARMEETIQDSWELILINDGSIDKSYELAHALVKDDPRVTLITYKKNRGRGYALRQGFNHSRGKYVVSTESDLTWGENIIKELYDELQSSQADVVIASPYKEGGKLENVPFKRALLSWLGNQILRKTVPSNITMLSGMTRGYIGNFIRSLPLEEDRKEIHLEIVSKAIMLNCDFSEIPAILRWEPPDKNKPQRKSKFNPGKLIRSHLLFGFNEAPIFLFGSLGVLAWIVGVMFGLYLSFLYFIKGQTIGDRVALILTTVFLVLVGFSSFLFCFLSYQIKDLRKEIFKQNYKRSDVPK